MMGKRVCFFSFQLVDGKLVKLVAFGFELILDSLKSQHVRANIFSPYVRSKAVFRIVGCKIEDI